jgi:hypothetical protein
VNDNFLDLLRFRTAQVCLKEDNLIRRDVRYHQMGSKMRWIKRARKIVLNFIASFCFPFALTAISTLLFLLIINYYASPKVTDYWIFSNFILFISIVAGVLFNILTQFSSLPTNSVDKIKSIWRSKVRFSMFMKIALQPFLKLTSIICFMIVAAIVIMGNQNNNIHSLWFFPFYALGGLSGYFYFNLYTAREKAIFLLDRFLNDFKKKYEHTEKLEIADFEIALKVYEKSLPAYCKYKKKGLMIKWLEMSLIRGARNDKETIFKLVLKLTNALKQENTILFDNTYVELNKYLSDSLSSVPSYDILESRKERIERNAKWLARSSLRQAFPLFVLAIVGYLIFILSGIHLPQIG